MSTTSKGPKRGTRAGVSGLRAPSPAPRPTPAPSAPAYGEALTARIRECAYRVFLERRGGPGDALSDWLQAEREVLAEVIAARTGRLPGVVGPGQHSPTGMPPSEVRRSSRGDILLHLDD